MTPNVFSPRKENTKGGSKIRLKLSRNRAKKDTFRFLEVKKEDSNNLIVTPQTATLQLRRTVMLKILDGQREQIKKNRLLKIIETQIDKDKAIVESRFTLNS